MLLVFECKNDEHPLDATQVRHRATINRTVMVWD
jgi:hypothetical protein